MNIFLRISFNDILSKKQLVHECSFYLITYMIHRNYTFKLKNKDNQCIYASVNASKINILIKPFIKINKIYIEANQMFVFNIRHIIELITNAKIESEHIGLINKSKTSNMKPVKHNSLISLQVKLQDIVVEDLNEFHFKDKSFTLTSDTSEWLFLYSM